MKNLSVLGVGAVVGIVLFSACGGSSVANSDATDTRHDVSGDQADGRDAPAVEAAPRDSGGDAATTGASCAAPSDCASGFCVDGVCCDSACSDACRSCALSSRLGKCSAVIKASDPGTCDGELTCGATGTCGKGLGKACAANGDCVSGSCVDGVCCSQDSCGTCQACNIGGSEGTCTPVPKLTEDLNSNCSGSMTCDGLGGCKRRNGEPCGQGLMCASGFCSDTVCCDQGCRGLCFGCAEPGKVGSCTVIAGYYDDDGDATCEVPKRCDAAGTGACKLDDGQPCVADTDCAFAKCQAYFKDGDGDGYGVSTTIQRRCDKLLRPQAGEVVEGGDCCDTDPNVHPGQSAFSTAASACGNHDYNCDTQETPDHATCGMGTISKPVPECGQACSFPILNTIYVAYTQGCR